MVLDMAPAQEGYPPETEGMSDAYRLPLLPIIPHLVAAPMIGAAQAAYDDYTAFLRDQVSTYNRSRVAEHVTVQLKVRRGRADGRHRAVAGARGLDGGPRADRTRSAVAADRPRALAAQRGLRGRVLRQGGRPDPLRLRRPRQLSRQRSPAPAPATSTPPSTRSTSPGRSTAPSSAASPPGSSRTTRSSS